MKNKHDAFTVDSYFAAANGFSGFRSYFSKLFDPYKLERIYVLKGGPGTGKSTLMKKLTKYAEERGIYASRIYCSSDPSSLDGVILADKLAVIDGTAPHERDAMLPGAVDEIINLGLSWNTKALQKSRKKIEKHNINKKRFYNSAYKYLSFSGNINNLIFDILNAHFLKEEAVSKIKKLLPKVSGTKPISKNECLISSFSKYGYLRLEDGLSIPKTIYNVTGQYGEEFLFMKKLEDYCDRAFNYIRFISPFDDGTTEGIYVIDSDTLFMVNNSNGASLDVTELIKIPHEEENELNFLHEEKEHFIEKSKLYFKKASDEHFKLEDIYTASMDFSVNESIYENLTQKISIFLDS